MTVRPAVALLALALACPAQEPAALRLPAVLEVLDAEPFDARRFEGLLDHGAAVAPLLAQAWSAAAPDEATATRRRNRALRALRALGPAATDAAQPLIDAVRAAERDDVPALLDTLSETAALGLEDPGALAGDAQAAFAPFVTPGDNNFLARLKAAIRLHVRLTRPLPAADVGALVAALEDPDPYVRELAAERLGRLGPAADEALDALERTARADDHPRRAALPNHSLGTDFAPLIRGAAEVAIARIAPQDPRAVPGLRALLEAPSPRERIEAAMALGRAGDPGSEAALRGALESDDLQLRAEAITALGMIGAASPRTVHALQQLLDHDDRGIAARARATLEQAGVKPSGGR